MPQAYRSVEITVNGQTYNKQVEPRRLLSDFLRDDLDLRGTHVGCEHGICGACTVLMNGHTVRSCLMFAVQANGAEITTIEGLAQEGRLHPIQQSFIDYGGFQCGICTPGQIMAAKALLDVNPNPTEDEIREWMMGNLCRCTGYYKILESVQQAIGPTQDAAR